MAASLISIIKEEARIAVTGDENYFKRRPYVFVLRAPGLEQSVGPLGEAVFPLPLNPDSFDYHLPYAAEVTPLQDGGVSAEEGGWVLGEITINATTGWSLKGVYDTSADRATSEFTGDLDPGVFGSVRGGLSGQMMFWRLANRCFEAYSQLKKDPKTASQTLLEFHSLKDDLHLTVVPRDFRLARDAHRDRVTYRFSVRLTVVGPASSSFLLVEPDLDVLKAIKDGIRSARQAVQSIKALVNDVTAAFDELRRSIQSIASVFSDLAGVVDAVTDHVNGVKKFVDIPKAFVQSIGEIVESVGNLAVNVAAWPAGVAQAFRQIGDELDRIQVAITDYGKQHPRDAFKRYKQLARGSWSAADPIRAQAESQAAEAARASGGRMSVGQAFGAVKPGDAERSQINRRFLDGRLEPGRYAGFEERIVTQGDTIQSLAAKYLGNARRWPEIVLVNNLQAPYITNGAQLPGTLQVGSRFTIPIERSSAATPNTVTTGDPRVGASQAEKILGRDFELTPLADGTFGWAIDTVQGGVDARHVEGVANLEQAILSRLRTEQGHNILYPAIGLPRAIGTPGFGTAIVRAQYETRRQLLADPRIRRVGGVRFTAENDVLRLEADVQPVGFSTTRPISRVLT